MRFFFFSVESIVTFELYFIQEHLNQASHVKYLAGTYNENFTCAFHIVNIAAQELYVGGRISKHAHWCSACAGSLCFICTSAACGRFMNLVVCCPRVLPFIGYAPFSLLRRMPFGCAWVCRDTQPIKYLIRNPEFCHLRPDLGI